jgi:hypothetical protein
MKRTILAAFAVLFLFASVGKAQTPVPAMTSIYDDHFRFLTGLHGGGDFGNYFLSLDAGMEIPFAKRFEIDLSDGFSPVVKVYNIVIPFEEHINLGTGSANTATVGSTVWVSPGKSLGLNGSVEYSSYSTMIHKGSWYASGGLTWRKVAWGMPTRFTFDYFRQFNNGIACGNIAACSLPGANGTETDHVQGGQFGMVTRMGTLGPTVIRMTFSTNVGHVLTQGNQFCDGSLGIYVPSCKRGSTVSGGASMGISFEWLRHRGDEYKAF